MTSVVASCSNFLTRRPNAVTSNQSDVTKYPTHQAFKLYAEECGACHITYPAEMLPSRSWKKLMNGLENHFGENAGLEKEPQTEITTFLVKHAADSKKSSLRSMKFVKSIPSNDIPLRITETPYWRQKHSAIKGFVWKRVEGGSKAKCDSCHKEANKGIFEEATVELPKSDSWL